MGCVAKGSITLDAVNDAYSVSLTKPSCVIHADFDGANPQLTNAQTTINVLRRDKAVAFDCVIIKDESTTDNAIATLTAYDSNTKYVLTITDVPTSVLEGVINVRISTYDGFVASVQFGYTVVRESTMLDWVQDWEGGKTKIGGTYIMTPKMFIGKKEDYAKYAEGGVEEVVSIENVPNLTGVYIGPDSDSTGIYGYKSGAEIFHLNNEGGNLGGWNINQDGIATTDKTLQILSEGSIISSSDNVTHYQLLSDGSATFANGKVKMLNDGSASFEGKITTSSGTIANWTIKENLFYARHLGLNASENYIAIVKQDANSFSGDAPFLDMVQDGGVGLYYTSESDFGICAYSNTYTKVFSVGTNNFIAGWNFDNEALWSGTKQNEANQYTTEAGSVTIGTNGLRGNSWYINADGTSSFVKGAVMFGETQGTIAGWTLDEEALYLGTKINDSSKFTAEEGSLTFGTKGIRGYQWRLETDGSASFGGGNVVFNQDGSGTLSGGNITWSADGDLSVSGKVNATSGNIGNWSIEDGVIVAYDTESTDSNYVKLDADNKKIVLQTNQAANDSVVIGNTNATITIDGVRGEIKVSAQRQTSDQGNTTSNNYISANGVFANVAGVNCNETQNGVLCNRAAIVGYGMANLDCKADQSTYGYDSTFVAGVYGRAGNTGNAPAYGGYFLQLKACGFIRNIVYLNDSSTSGQELSKKYTTIVSTVSSSSETKIIYLPTDAVPGQEIELMQMGDGVVRLDTKDGSLIYDDTSVNEYYDTVEGWSTICTRAFYGQTAVWLIRQYQFHG